MGTYVERATSRRGATSTAAWSTRWFAPNLDALSGRFHTYTPELRGHGHTPDAEGPITYEAMADDTIAFLEAVVGEPAGTWSGTAPGRSCGCWWRCAAPSRSSGWC